MTEATEATETAAAEVAATPTLQILTPGVTAEETAIVVALFAGMGNGEGTEATKPRGQWNAPHRTARRSLFHGAGGWRASGMPR